MNTTDEIRAAVLARTRQEQDELARKEEGKENPKALTHDLILNCLKNGTYGLGVLYARLFLDRLIYVPEQDEWFEWTGHCWEMVYKYKPLTLHLLDTDYFKSYVTARLDSKARSPFRLHSQCEQTLADQLSAEVLELTPDKRRVWRKRRRDNHLLDCLCLNAACVHSAWTPSLGRLVADLRGRLEAVPGPMPPAVLKEETRLW